LTSCTNYSVRFFPSSTLFGQICLSSREINLSTSTALERLRLNVVGADSAVRFQSRIGICARAAALKVTPGLVNEFMRVFANAILHHDRILVDIVGSCLEAQAQPGNRNFRCIELCESMMSYESPMTVTRGIDTRALMHGLPAETVATAHAAQSRVVESTAAQMRTICLHSQLAAPIVARSTRIPSKVLQTASWVGVFFKCNDKFITIKMYVLNLPQLLDTNTATVLTEAEFRRRQPDDAETAAWGKRCKELPR